MCKIALVDQTTVPRITGDSMRKRRDDTFAGRVSWRQSALLTATLTLATLFVAGLTLGCHSRASDNGTTGGDSKLENAPVAPTATESPARDSSTDAASQSYADLLAQGDAFGLQGDYVTAIHWYAQAVKLDPQRAEGYAKRAAALSSSGNLDGALTDFNQAIQLAPSDPELYLSRAKLQLIFKRADLALADCDTAIRLSPQHAKARLYRANVHLERGEFDAAIDDYNVLLAATPSFASAYSNRGVAYRSKGDYARAIADYTSAIRYNTQFAEAYNNRGEIYLRQGDNDRAMADFNQALRIDPAEFDSYDNRAALYLLLGKPELAIADYSAIIDRTVRMAAKSNNLHPSAKLANEYLKRASAHLKAHQANEAIADVGESVRINPGDSRAYAIRRDAYLALGKTELARADDDLAKRLEQTKSRPAARQPAKTGPTDADQR
jgi:tetratricopeptide (TPR) repeat protein